MKRSVTGSLPSLSPSWNSHDLEALREAFVIVNRKGIASTILYTCSVPLAFVNPLLSGIIFAIVSVIWLIPDKNIERALKEKV